MVSSLAKYICAVKSGSLFCLVFFFCSCHNTIYKQWCSFDSLFSPSVQANSQSTSIDMSCTVSWPVRTFEIDSDTKKTSLPTDTVSRNVLECRPSVTSLNRRLNRHEQTQREGEKNTGRAQQDDLKNNLRTSCPTR